MNRVLEHGQFLGTCTARRETCGFSFAELTPTVPPEEVGTHTHEDAHFVLLLAGDYVTSAGPDESPVLIYNPPGTTHRDRFRQLDGRFFTISIARQSLLRMAELDPLPDTAIALASGPAVTLARRLAIECRRWDDTSPLETEGLALDLLSRMTQTRERSHRHAPPWLRSAREFLRDRSSESLRVADVAACAGVHPVHLIRTFREFFGATPGEYLRRCRLEYAARMLAATDLPLVRIALDAGFADQSHFAKAFRREFDITPREYRRAMSNSGRRVYCVQERVAAM